MTKAKGEIVLTNKFNDSVILVEEQTNQYHTEYLIKFGRKISGGIYQDEKENALYEKYSATRYGKKPTGEFLLAKDKNLIINGYIVKKTLGYKAAN